jgi:hypothetical protein
MASFLTMPIPESTDEIILARLYETTHVVEYSPNCVKRFLVRLGSINHPTIDKLPYYPEDNPPTKDMLGFGNTLAEAARVAFYKQDQAHMEFDFPFAARAWEHDSRFDSHPGKEHFSYQSILKMGPGVIPLVLKRIQRRPSWLVIILPDLTGENPCPAQYAGRLKEQIEHWLMWGKEKGHLSAGA